MAEEPPLDTVFPPCERPPLRRGPTRVGASAHVAATLCLYLSGWNYQSVDQTPG